MLEGAENMLLICVVLIVSTPPSRKETGRRGWDCSRGGRGDQNCRRNTQEHGSAMYHCAESGTDIETEGSGIRRAGKMVERKEKASCALTKTVQWVSLRSGNWRLGGRPDNLIKELATKGRPERLDGGDDSVNWTSEENVK